MQTVTLEKALSVIPHGPYKAFSSEDSVVQGAKNYFIRGASSTEGDLLSCHSFNDTRRTEEEHDIITAYFAHAGNVLPELVQVLEKITQKHKDEMCKDASDRPVAVVISMAVIERIAMIVEKAKTIPLAAEPTKEMLENVPDLTE